MTAPCPEDAEEDGSEPETGSGRPRLRGRSGGRICRVVTAEISARLLLAGQLRAMPDLKWAVVSGDVYDNPPANVDTYQVPMRRELALSDISSFVGLFRLFRRERFALVQTHTPKASLLALPAARFAGTPSIYTVHGAMYFKGNGRRSNFLGWLFERWCCSWAKFVVVQSAEDHVRLPAVRICRRSKLGYLGNGISLARFLEPVTPILQTNRPIVLMVSRLVTEKGCRDFFRMADLLGDRADFVHVGPMEPDQRDGIRKAEMESLAAEGVLAFVGPVDDVRPYVASAAVVVLPSYREGMPRAAMEAAAMGRAVAAYDIRGVREVIPPETGLLAARGDVIGLTAIVQGLLDDPDRRAELARQCRQSVVERYSEDHVVDRLRAIYARVEAAHD